jgi:hypothetical protein
MGTVSFRVHNKSISDFSVSIASNSVKIQSFSQVCHFLDVFSKGMASQNDVFLSSNPCQIATSCSFRLRICSYLLYILAFA